jgi:hypothetical protein
MNPTSPKDASEAAPRLLHRKAASGGPLKPEFAPPERPREIGGRKDGSEPTRYGDWEKSGRCVDF